MIITMNASDYDNKKLQTIREKYFTQTELAARLEVAPETISRAERGVSASFQLLSAMTKECKSSIKEIILDNSANIALH